jgi:hypothetical protein
MLVARCVEPGLENSGWQIGGDVDQGKTSAEGFARESGIAANTVRRYLEVWAALSDAGEVIPAAGLAPGSLAVSCAGVRCVSGPTSPLIGRSYP